MTSEISAAEEGLLRTLEATLGIALGVDEGLIRTDARFLSIAEAYEQRIDKQPEGLGGHWLPIDPDATGRAKMQHGPDVFPFHRISYDLYVADIDGRQVQIRCGEFGCSRPSHLALTDVLLPTAAPTRACVRGHVYTDFSVMTSRYGARQCKLCSYQKKWSSNEQ